MSAGRVWDKIRRVTFESPVITFSVVVGTLGPLMALTAPSVRSMLGYQHVEPLPFSYPLPNRPRNPPAGYDD
ncbi:hypothetical protein BDF22DRAFT_740662 [Syncephalis plumigaleata]|nr:hypothetical protein BDF22DRAFT_740662 [Syncephalis plumigaleata]